MRKLRHGAEEARRFGLPCGGTMELVLEPLASPAPLDALLERLAAGELVERRLHLASGRSTLATAHPEQVPGFDGETLVSVFGPRYRLLLIGAGQLSACLHASPSTSTSPSPSAIRVRNGARNGANQGRADARMPTTW